MVTVALFQLADYLQKFGTCTADSDGNAFSGYSKLNKDIFKLFQRGESEVTAAHAATGAARQAQCDAVSSTMEQVGTKMLTMFIQGTLRYLYKTSTQSSKEAGELLLLPQSRFLLSMLSTQMLRRCCITAPSTSTSVETLQRSRL